MSSNGVLIVGACQAGLQLAVSLRELGHDGVVTLVGAEPHAPYQRPPLSKAYLSGATGMEALTLRSPEFYVDQRIDLVCGERVAAVDLDRGEARTDSGRTLGFDRLALTTGARVRRLTVPGAELRGVCYLRDVQDADRLARALPDARSVVVIGGGFIGLEAAAVAGGMGKKVTIVETAARLVSRAVAPVVSDFYLRAHRRRGAEVRLEAVVTALEGRDGAVAGVRLSDGDVLPADVVLVGIGVEPRVELAQQMGLRVQGAVVVDRYARTSDPRVVAAGDVTLLPSPSTADGYVRLESVQNAVDQAKTAAATLMGREEPYVAAPWFWSEQYDLKLQIAGLSAGFDQVVLRGLPDTERFSALYYRQGRLLASDSVNRGPDFLAVRRALSAGATIPPDAAVDESIPLKTLISA